MFQELLSTAIQTFDFKIALLIFVSYIIIEALYAYYTLTVVNHKPLAAASTSALMHFLLAFGVINYVHNYLYVIPIALGAWIGTFLAVKKGVLKFPKHHK